MPRIAPVNLTDLPPEAQAAVDEHLRRQGYLNDSALIGPIVFLKSIKSVCHSQELTCFHKL